MRVFRTFVAIAVTVAAFFAVARCGLNLFAWGRITGAPTPREFEAIAREGQPLAQAVVDYRSDHGLLPENQKDLVPAYLSKWPKGWSYGGGSLDHLSGLPHTHIECGFYDTTNRWELVGEYAHGRTINVPGPIVKKTSVSTNALFAKQLAEFEKRILSNPRDKYSYGDKIAFTALSGSNDLAIAECNRAITFFPDWWFPQLALAELATNDLQVEQNFKAWIQAHPTFINYWYLSHFYREKDDNEAAFAALDQAVGGSFTSDAAEIDDLKLQLRLAASGKPSKRVADETEDAMWDSDGFALDAVRFCCENRKYELAQKIIQHCSMDNSPYQACVELGLGQFDAAIADAHKAARSNPQSDWARQLPQFLEVVNVHGTNFCFSDSNEDGSDWVMFTMPGEISSQNTDNAEAALRRGINDERMGDWDASIAECTKVIQQKPRHGNAYNLRAWAEFLINDLDPAISDATRAIQLNLNSGNAYGTRGWARHGKGDTTGALEDLKTAIALCGETSVEGTEDQGLIEFINNHNQNAINFWRKAVQMDPAIQKTLQPWIENATQRAGR